MTRGEIPASPTPGDTIAIHWSRKQRGWGIRITTMPSGDYGIWTIAPVNGQPTAHMFDRRPTEKAARTAANTAWTDAQL